MRQVVICVVKNIEQRCLRFVDSQYNLNKHLYIFWYMLKQTKSETIVYIQDSLSTNHTWFKLICFFFLVIILSAKLTTGR